MSDFRSPLPWVMGGVLGLVLASLACVLAVITFAPILSESRDTFRDSEFRFIASDSPFLEEDVAVRIALDSMKRCGYDVSRWHLSDESPSTAPDGKHDTHLYRNSDPTKGFVVLYSDETDTRQERQIFLIQDEDRIGASVVAPK